MVGGDLDQAAVEQIIHEIRRAGGTAHALVATDVARMVQQTIETGGRIDILDHAVGGSTIIPNSGATVDELTLDELQRLVIFSLNGTFLFCNAVVPIMKRQHSGKIVNISSIAGRGLSQSSSSAYAKGGIIAFTRKRSFEFGPYGITWNAIALSRTLNKRIHACWRQMSEAEQAAEIARTPRRRIAQPEDQARVICFLASADADFVTGVTVDVTGGQ
jgi:NAD(P)-dependent dehydrogenase (short-subunit alcohol dehydrogenase family)